MTIRQGRGHHPADHWDSNALHHFRPGTVGPHDREQPGHDGCDGHHFWPHALNSAFHDGGIEIVAREWPAFGFAFGSKLAKRSVEVN